MRTIRHYAAGLFGTPARVRFKNAFAMPGSGAQDMSRLQLAQALQAASPAAAAVAPPTVPTPAAPPPTVPTPEPPPTMPDPNSPSALEARKRQMAQTNAGGRSSTILTTPMNRALGTLASGNLAGRALGA
jgi:hypothetical protein